MSVSGTAQVGGSAGDGEDRLEAIVGSGVVPLDRAARDTLVNDYVPTTLGLHRDRFHQSATERTAVSRVHVDVFAVKAARTVVRVSGSAHGAAAILANEIFDLSREFFHFGDNPARSRRS